MRPIGGHGWNNEETAGGHDQNEKGITDSYSRNKEGETNSYGWNKEGTIQLCGLTAIIFMLEGKTMILALILDIFFFATYHETRTILPEICPLISSASRVTQA